MGRRSREAGDTDPRDSTLAVISWFIPIVSLWWPYESLRDCVPSDATPTRKRNSPL
ncbi:MAG: DUF4328 domain-containing protein, partial [Actinobacteria bacterium]|nr:DUF4328 domain-containing protein [Actinomycetota bacterium]